MWNQKRPEFPVALEDANLWAWKSCPAYWMGVNTPLELAKMVEVADEEITSVERLDLLEKRQALQMPSRGKDLKLLLTKPLRDYYRKKYREAADEYMVSHTHRELLGRYQYGEHSVDTYLWPYRSQAFADWPEEDGKYSYSLISDPSGFVIRHSTSYCAYKIFESTGNWPQRKSLHRRFDAKDWVEFLAEAGYPNTVLQLAMGHKYVGIDPKRGEHGQVVWAESEDTPATHEMYISTYINRQHHFGVAHRDDYIWVMIK